MSYDISFNLNGETCMMNVNVPAGGTYCVGGTNEACLNITYNYFKNFAEHGISMCWHKEDPETVEFLDGKMAKECVRILQKAIQAYENPTDSSENYWESTDSNCLKALKDLLFISENVPKDAICVVE